MVTVMFTALRLSFHLRLFFAEAFAGGHTFLKR